ncbi:hypothetical protein HPB49_010844 [Dermacentor silvarum]|uniref:Uncharacterized protein n=1 Tax=Dermacentor silvarum TaxID=543639 RepID=A0ACB8DZQ4_DERSI|nr:hypothetical protein HPB49_010844 [Dermacentor silvarum]
MGQLLMQCGCLGHRVDVCPTPGDVICRGYGAPSPDEQHQCTPKCILCGGQHLTPSKKCAQRFKIPYILRRRRSKRAKMAGADTADNFQASSTLGAQRRGRSRSRGRSASRGRSGSRSGSRGRACSRGRSGSRPRSSSRPGHDTSGRIRSRSRTSTALRSKKKLTLSWADKARGGREAPEATTCLAVRTTRTSSRSCAELTSS